MGSLSVPGWGSLGPPMTSMLKVRWLTVLTCAAMLAVAGGVAWACGPGGYGYSVHPTNGSSGTRATLHAAGFPNEPVEIRWNSAGGPVLGNAHGPQFSVAVTIPAAQPGVYTVLARGTVTGTTTPVAFTVTEPPALSVSPASGPAGSRVHVEGSRFPPSGAVELRWDSLAGPLLAMATAPTFTQTVTVPSDGPGGHSIVAVSPHLWSGSRPAATQAFQLTPRPAATTVLVTSGADSVGPAITGAALSIANRGRRVSARGFVTLVCGTFREDGVVGRCGARAVRGATPRLRARSFRATLRRPVRVRFRLSRKGLASLEKTGRKRMRGHVAARDQLGNPSAARFRFTLLAPRRAGAPARATATAAGPIAGW